MGRTAAHRRAGVRRRLGLWLLILVLAGTVGVFWAEQRRERTVEGVVRLSLSAVLEHDGTLAVTEELVLLSTTRPVIQQVLVAPGGVRWGGVTDGSGRPLEHTTVAVTDGLQVSVPLVEGQQLLHLRYDLLDAAAAGTDAVELRWPVTDDRSTLALDSVELDLSWSGGGVPEIIELEAPGTTSLVDPREGAARIELGRLPAHHAVEVHAALPRSAVGRAMGEDRSVMADMAERRPPLDAGGGPWWLPLLVAGTAALVAVGVSRRHGRVPLPPPDPAVRQGTPAEVAWLLRHGVVRTEDIVATLVDLTHRGVLDVDGPAWVLPPTVGWGTAAPHEALLIRWLFGTGTTVDPQAVVARVAADAARWRDLRRRFIDAVEDMGDRAGLLDRAVDDEQVVGAGVAAAGLVVGGVVGMALGQPLWIACVAVGGLALTSLDTLARYSPEGARRAAAWLERGEQLEAAGVVPDEERASALVLDVPGAHNDRTRRIQDVVQALDHAYAGTTTYLTAPRRRAGV